MAFNQPGHPGRGAGQTMLQSLKVDAAKVLIQGLGQDLMTFEHGVSLVEVIACLRQCTPVRLQAQLGRFHGMGLGDTSHQGLTLQRFQSEQL